MSVSQSLRNKSASSLKQKQKGNITVDLLKELVVIGVSTLIVLIVSEILDDKELIEKLHSTSNWIKNNPLYAKAIASIPVVVFIDLLRFIPKVVKISKKAKMSDNVGLFYYSPNSSEKVATKSLRLMQEKSVDSKIVYIRCATGWLTFGAEGSPLHEAIKSNAKDIKIILANPESERVLQRADSLNVDRHDYASEIRKSFNFLMEVKRKGRKHTNIEVKFYDKAPCWKDIIIDDLAWMYHYDEGVHVANTPCYAFVSIKKKPRKHSDMYESLYDEFLSEWENPNLKKIPISEKMAIQK